MPSKARVLKQTADAHCHEMTGNRGGADTGLQSVKLAPQQILETTAAENVLLGFIVASYCSLKASLCQKNDFCTRSK